MTAKLDRQPVPRNCAHCGGQFDAGLDYEGRPHAPTRRYCDGNCRRLARNAHARAVTAWEHENEYLAVLHETERFGQLSLDDRPLPELPPRPERGAA
ncbi:MAG: hypothetical protein JWO67_4109 [Streptosporangiaceae bacterium]|nr:hypothetical protein [Streptosporangiaceae bacterium]